MNNLFQLDFSTPKAERLELIKQRIKQYEKEKFKIALKRRGRK